MTLWPRHAAVASFLQHDVMHEAIKFIFKTVITRFSFQNKLAGNLKKAADGVFYKLMELLA